MVTASDVLQVRMLKLRYGVKHGLCFNTTHDSRTIEGPTPAEASYGTYIRLSGTQVTNPSTPSPHSTHRTEHALLRISSLKCALIVYQSGPTI